MTNPIDPARRFYLRELRIRAGMTQEQLADAIGTSKGLVSQMETGAHRYNEGWVDKIAAVLGIEPADLLTPPGAVSISTLADPRLTSIVAVWPHIPERQREAIANLARTFGGQGEGG